MTSLRRAIAWATTLACPFSAADIVALSGNDMQGVRPYLARLTHDHVLTQTADETYTAGPKAPEWRKIKPKTEPGGGAKLYRAAKATRDRLAQADWQARRSPSDPVPLTRQETTGDDSVGQQTTDDDRRRQDMLSDDSIARMIDLQTVSVVLHVSERTVQRLIRTKELRSYRIGKLVRFQLSDVHEFLQKRAAG